ncbi:hypothetical protein Gogos_022311 [Gossypium gossypioides]|uniref:Uncharacterized protein n=1 Tax=Gossypium gossypioides TaxID=34282 RepID=A0A7J9D1V0_GOSGO|nr:hypothetical protein [Gossypium gossypioides]
MLNMLHTWFIDYQLWKNC